MNPNSLQEWIKYIVGISICLPPERMSNRRNSLLEGETYTTQLSFENSVLIQTIAFDILNETTGLYVVFQPPKPFRNWNLLVSSLEHILSARPPSARVRTTLHRLVWYHWETFTDCREKTNFKRQKHTTFELRPNCFIPPQKADKHDHCSSPTEAFLALVLF